MKFSTWICILIVACPLWAADDESAQALWLKVANQDAEAAYALGMKYYFGSGVDKDFQRAMPLFENSIKWGRDPAMPNFFIEQIKALESEDAKNKESQKSAGDNAKSSALQSDIVVGDQKSHVSLWNQFVQWKDSKNENDRIWQEKINANQNAAKQKADLEEKISSLRSQIDARKSQASIPAEVPKDEFETTSEWHERCNKVTAKRNADIQSDIDDLNGTIANIQAQIEKIGDLTPPDRPTSEPLSITPDSVEFLLKARMGQYNADAEKVEEFTHDAWLNVGNSGSDPQLFEINGDLSGISIPRDKAKLAREASDRDELWVSFRAKPKKFEFEGNYFTSSTHTENVYHSGPLPSGKTLATRGLIAVIGNLLGADPNTTANACATVEDKPETKTVTTQEYHTAQIIKTGWYGTCSPESVIIFDHVNNQWIKLWEKTP